jgi:hypothetical protein
MGGSPLSLYTALFLSITHYYEIFLKNKPVATKWGE